MHCLSMVLQQTWQEGVMLDDPSAFVLWLKRDLGTRYQQPEDLPADLLALIDVIGSLD